jgi:hypothetical protein
VSISKSNWKESAQSAMTGTSETAANVTEGIGASMNYTDNKLHFYYT